MKALTNVVCFIFFSCKRDASTKIELSFDTSIIEKGGNIMGNDKLPTVLIFIALLLTIFIPFIFFPILTVMLVGLGLVKIFEIFGGER